MCRRTVDKEQMEIDLLQIEVQEGTGGLLVLGSGWTERDWDEALQRWTRNRKVESQMANEWQQQMSDEKKRTIKKNGEALYGIVLSKSLDVLT